MKKFIHAASAFSLVAALAMAAPSGPVPRTLQETPGEPYTSTGPYQAASANFTQVLSTGFEAPDWQAGNSVCGDVFGYDECVGGICAVGGGVCVTNADCANANPLDNITCTYPVANTCLNKNHNANQNCCPDEAHNILLGDPNPYTGWSMSPSSRHCRTPGISTANPFAGTQHLRFERDPAGGLPVGCASMGSACRTRAITAQVTQADVSHAVWSMEINWSNTLGSGMVQFIGQDTTVGSVYLLGYIYWYYLGGVYIYDLNAGTFRFGGYWSDYIGLCDPITFLCNNGGAPCLLDSDCPDLYANFTADFNPCDDTVTYSYGGAVVHTEAYGFNPPLGDFAADTRAPVADTTFYTQDNFSSITDIDNHFVTYTPCTNACCDGNTGVCTDGADPLSCGGVGQHYYPNVLCSQLGTAAKYPPACNLDTAACCDRSTLVGLPGDPLGICTDVDQASCSGPTQSWDQGSNCNEVNGLCNLGAGNCSGGFCDYGHGKVGGPCATARDCDVAGLCYKGTCTQLGPIGTCSYISLGFCQAMGRCSGSPACDPLTGAGCCDPVCPVPCPGVETCEVEPQPCSIVPQGFDCAFCEGCDPWPPATCNIDADCVSPGIGIPPGTCVPNPLTGCNADADCSVGNTCVIPVANSGGELCLSNADCHIPGTTAPCERDTGACCDHAAAGGVCTDNALVGDCAGPWQDYSPFVPCSMVEPCDALGCCCNALDGTFVERTLESDCRGDLPNQFHWTLGTFCADAGCGADMGACCDTDPFGGCTDTTYAGCPAGEKLVWHKLELCADIDCVHNAIPTVSEWGLVVLTLLLLTGAKVYFGRRQAVA